MFAYAYLCEHYAKASNTVMRVYRGNELLTSYSMFPLEFDPFLPFCEKVLAMPNAAGIITTPLLQFYGYFDVCGGYRFVIGPSGIMADDPKLLSQLLFQLGVPAKKQAAYVRQLRSMPNIGLERLAWTIQFLVCAIDGRKLLPEEIAMPNAEPADSSSIASDALKESVETCDDFALLKSIDQSYAFETMLWSLIRNGEPGHVRAWIARSPDDVQAGDMAQDVLRQIKNMGICGAAVAARTAISAGMGIHAAMQLSDVYIRKFELLDKGAAVIELLREMFIEYAARVRQAKLGLDTHSLLLDRCARYISSNLTKAIRVEEMARAFGMGRSYLCTRFRQEAGVTLTQFIRHEKVLEAQRLLERTDRTLPEIADYLAFSSQSHFQNTFKQFSGTTPGEYRRTHRAVIDERMQS